MRELPQVRPGEQFTEFGLPDQDNLQQFLFRSLEVGEKPYLLEHSRREILGFIDHEDGAAPRGVRVQQVPVQCVRQRLDAAPVVPHFDMQFLANRGEELDDGQLRVQDHGHVRVVGHAIQ